MLWLSFPHTLSISLFYFSLMSRNKAGFIKIKISLSERSISHGLLTSPQLWCSSGQQQRTHFTWTPEHSYICDRQNWTRDIWFNKIFLWGRFRRKKIWSFKHVKTGENLKLWSRFQVFSSSQATPCWMDAVDVKDMTFEDK